MRESRNNYNKNKTSKVRTDSKWIFKYLPKQCTQWKGEQILLNSLIWFLNSGDWWNAHTMICILFQTSHRNFWRICGFNVRSRNQYLQHLHWQIASGVHMSFFRVLSLSGMGWYNDIVQRRSCKHFSCLLSRLLVRKMTGTTHKERDALFWGYLYFFCLCWRFKQSIHPLCNTKGVVDISDSEKALLVCQFQHPIPSSTVLLKHG